MYILLYFPNANIGQLITHCRKKIFMCIA